MFIKKATDCLHAEPRLIDFGDQLRVWYDCAHPNEVIKYESGKIDKWPCVRTGTDGWVIWYDRIMSKIFPGNYRFGCSLYENKHGKKGIKPGFFTRNCVVKKSTCRNMPIKAGNTEDIDA